MQRARNPLTLAWNRIAGHDQGEPISITVNGRVVPARSGESLAAALAVAGISVLRHSPTASAPRGVFCLMGSCQECLVHIDGTAVLACMEQVRAGMEVTLDLLARARQPE